MIKSKINSILLIILPIIVLLISAVSLNTVYAKNIEAEKLEAKIKQKSDLLKKYQQELDELSTTYGKSKKASKLKEDEKATLAKNISTLKSQINLAKNGVVDSALTNNASSGSIQFDSNGLLVESASANAQQAINLLLGIPGHANGSGYHVSTGLDSLIDSLSTPEAIYVIHKIEGAGFGQTGAGYAGTDSAQTHQAFINQQVNGRFGGSVHALLKAWGTYAYGGY